MFWLLLEANGLVFPVLSVIALLAISVSVDQCDESPIASIILGSYLAATYAFTNAVEFVGALNYGFWPWFGGISAYLTVGAAWWLFVFRFHLGLLRDYINSCGDSDGARRSLSKGKSYFLPNDMRRIYETEPSFSTASDRILLWPLSIIRFFGDDFIKLVFNALKNHKRRFLGLETDDA